MEEIRRNVPCPCNSGKRYKHCCGSIANAAADESIDNPLIQYLRNNADGRLVAGSVHDLPKPLRAGRKSG